MKEKFHLINQLETAIDRAVDPVTRTVYLVGEIENGASRAALTGLRVLDGRRGAIRLVLASTGGCVEMAYALYDAIVTCRNQVTVDAYGVCQSAGMLLLAAGDTRRVGPECRLMIHRGSFTVTADAGAAQAIGEEIRTGVERYCDLIAKRSGRSLREVMKWAAQETYFGADEALDLGLVDEIIDKKERR